MIHLTTAAQKHTYSAKNRLKLAGVFCALLMAGSPFAYADLLTDAQNGDVKAQIELSRYYLWGSRGYPRDIQQGYNWLLKAAEQGSTEALVQIGDMYSSPTTSPTGKQEPQLAQEWYQKAVDLGSTAAMIKIGDLYIFQYRSPTGKAEPRTAEEWYLKAADLGDTKAMIQITRLYNRAYMSPTGKADPQKIEEWLLRAANQDDGFAQLRLGFFYRNEDGESGAFRNADKAFFWFTQSAQNKRNDQNHTSLPSSYSSLRDMIRFGEKQLSAQEQQDLLAWVLEKAANNQNVHAQTLAGFLYNNQTLDIYDAEKAFEWYQRAAQQGSPIAKNELAIIYLDEKSTHFNPQQALDLLNQEVEKWNHGAEFQLAELYFEGKFVPQDNQLAFALLKKAAYGGNIDAQYKLAQLYDSGTTPGITQDKAAAFTFFMQAAQQNYPPAQYRLALIYCNGGVLARDVEEGRAWLIRAEQGDVAEAREALQTVCK
ncbi:Secretory immunoglobulin A-binding protein EsiB [Saezia sanguinis]|uniref:Secretory immunoglobulin A-binding protein EsiB n=1 Tax=Saezia sanguinis TaxID=1965230 RepID=A0A433SD08_9BURK|nr:tetratricopeptide repeat protein [Saezia sanguinis]RUS66632.1 Secretory immunoglobulin A-binding protein EsiB [Saezia sanguinis]